MKINFKIFAFVFLTLSSVSSGYQAIASFEDRGWGVIPVGMGGAYAAQSNDGSAFFWNPAGSASIERFEIDSMWERIHPEITDVKMVAGFLSAAMPTKKGTFGFGTTLYSVENLLSENTYILNYARNIGPAWAAGVNFKYLTHNYEIGSDPSNASNPVFANGTSKSAFTFDAGTMWTPYQKLRFGLGVKNVIEPDVGLVLEDRVPREYQGGLSYRFGKRTTVETDFSYRNQDAGGTNDKWNLHLGAEHWFPVDGLCMAALRAGYNRNLSNKRGEAALGSSLQLWEQRSMSLRVDYAFVVNMNYAGDFSGLEKSKAGNHKVGLSMLFGSPTHDSRLASNNADMAAPPAASSIQTGRDPLGPEMKVEKLFSKSDVVAVLDVQFQRVSETDAKMLSALLQTAVSKMFTVVDKNAVKNLQQKQGLKTTACGDLACAVNLGKRLKANKVLFGSISYLGQQYQLKISIADVWMEKVQYEDQADFPLIEDMREEVNALANRLAQAVE